MGGIKVSKNHHEVDEWGEGCTVDPPSALFVVITHDFVFFLTNKKYKKKNKKKISRPQVPVIPLGLNETVLN